MAKIKFFISISFLCLYVLPAKNYFVVYFKDKEGNDYSLSKPEEYLSNKALQRRQKENIGIDITDLPVSRRYVDSLKAKGLEVIYTSKWLNAALVYDDEVNLQGLDYQLFGSYAKVSRIVSLKKDLEIRSEQLKTASQGKTFYGASFNQLHMMNMDSLHREGFTGASILLGVFDEGFVNVNSMKAYAHLFDQNKIIDTYNFVDRKIDVYDKGEHGTKVLSCIAAKLDSIVVGGAYNVNLALYHTEDAGKEAPVEEFYYVLAAERADSLGVDIVSTSLGYRDFDNTLFDHSYNDLNGRKTIASFAARALARKGVVLVTSAGNTGDSSFKTIGTPADADSVITVGAVNSSYIKTSFSSVGPTVDGRLKPEVSALGEGVSFASIFVDSGVSTGSGTSFAAPLIAAFVVLAKEKYPDLKTQELIHYVKKSSSNAATPNNNIGYGVPYYGTRESASEVIDDRLNAYFVEGNLYLQKDKLPITAGEISDLRLYNLSGSLMFSGKNLEYLSGVARLSTNNLSLGLYIGFIARAGRVERLLLIKDN
jgi:serine protease AprX